MANSPVWSGSPLYGRVAITAANTKSDGSGTIGTDIFLLASAGANGANLGQVEVLATASVAATATTTTVLRVYFSTQSSGNTTSGNTFLIREWVLSSTTAASTAAGVPVWTVPLNTPVETGLHVLVSTHHAPAANTSVVAHLTQSGNL